MSTHVVKRVRLEPKSHLLDDTRDIPAVTAVNLPVGKLTAMPDALRQREAANASEHPARASTGNPQIMLAGLLEWVPMNRYCEISGETPDAVDKRVRSGFWLRDVHVRRPPGSKQLWINLPAVNNWAAGKTIQPRKRA